MPSTLFHQLGQHIQATMSHYHVPGVAVGMQHGGRAHSAGFGVTNVEHPLPVDADTLFQVGSITKTLTGTALLRLAEAGQVDLDLPLRRYLPELALADDAVAARVTLRHVLTHTGGWAGDYFDDTGPGDDALARLLPRLARLPQLTPLGEVYSYNNAGFYLAGRVLEVATGLIYEEAARQLVLEPLEMRHSFFFAGDAITHRVAAGHEAVYDPPGPGAAAPLVARPWGLARSAHPVGGLISSVADQLRYARFHLGDGVAPGGQRLLSTAALAGMHAPHAAAANDESIGLTWFSREIDGQRLLRHGGATHGQAALFLMAPARQFALVVLTNSDRGREVHQAAATWALANILGLHETAPRPLPAGADQLQPYVGRYRAPAADRVLTLADGVLWLQVEPRGGFPAQDSPPGPRPPVVRLALCGPDQVLALDEPMQGERGEFLRGPDGGIAWLRMSGRLHAREG